MSGVSNGGSSLEGSYKCLFDADFQAMHKKGLCFLWDEKFIVGHWCKARDLCELCSSMVHSVDKEFDLLDDGEEDSVSDLH